MIQETTGDILVANVDAIVNPVNCVGVMGRGLALQYKERFPDNFEAYARACQKKLVQPGKMFVFERPEARLPKFVINFPTKRHWRDKSLLADIDAGLVALRTEVETRKIQSIAIPPIGCGLGGLKWEDVHPRIMSAFAELDDVHVLLFPPS